MCVKEHKETHLYNYFNLCVFTNISEISALLRIKFQHLNYLVISSPAGELFTAYLLLERLLTALIVAASPFCGLLPRRAPKHVRLHFSGKN